MIGAPTLRRDELSRRAPTFLRGVIVATLVAGPLALLGAFFVDLGWEVLRGHSPLAALAMIVFLPLAFLVGGAVSLLPNLLGTVIMAHFGRRHAAARKRWVWTFGGSLIGGIMGFAISGFELSAVGAGDGIGCTALGGACALICHWGTCWYDYA